MSRYIFVIAILLWVGSAAAEIEVKSCDNMFSAKSSHGSIVVERAGKVVGTAKIDHDIDGGVFSLDDSLMIVYGVPKKISRQYPQRTILSVYRIFPHPAVIMSEVYGGGVYDASFSDSQKFVVVDNQFGIDVLDVIHKKSKSFDSAYNPDFSTQKCEPK
ncbi:hypothetical protein [Burkholderia ubonensis]|uniref:hypothetical protein n=1 Tax=Burkholderia ubonensis TaxID=101571 RepID=UPI0005D80BB7|nr:hypothetical protein [Burkholderia ubonensis]AJX14348.1 hypothetical protein BW23_5870 [Burkholderia ubonensis MSMB22]